MKKSFIHITLCLIFLLTGSEAAIAQQNNFDSDIYAIRNNDFPTFRYTYDDYLQYCPAGAMVLMKACGYESRSSWGRMLTADAFSVALMAAAVNGIKYTAKRLRPDGSRRNSFPSGHTATAFMSATMLHKEYGWRSPWISIGGYTVAAVTGVSRIMNNRHWMTDVVAGAAIGVGAVHLGYYLTDLIFKEKGLNSSFAEPSFCYDSGEKHYVAEMLFGHRLFFGKGAARHGGTVSLSTDIPIVPNLGITARGSANSIVRGAAESGSNMYSAGVGGYWNFFYAKRFEFQAHALLGGAWFNSLDGSGLAGTEVSTGFDATAGLGISFLLDSNFKLKAFADYETISTPARRPWLHSVILGFSSAWFW